MKPTTKNVLYFLRESNAIENEFDRQSLVDAHRAWKYITQFDKLTNGIIKETHAILMKSRSLPPKYKGDWRDVPVWIGNEKKSQPKVVIDSLMRDFCEDVNKLDPGDNLIGRHLMFESIHPFVDGNGRMGRILLNWQAIKTGKDLIVFTNGEKYEKYYPLFGQSKKTAGKRLLTMHGLDWVEWSR